MRCAHKGAASDNGLTLIELIVVMAVFALVATMSIQALSGTLRTRDRLSKVEAETASISRAMALLRADLQAAVPMDFSTPNGRIMSAFDLAVGGQELAFSLSGRHALPGEQTAGLGRVIWRFDRGQGLLIRQSWSTLMPADQTSLGPEVVIADQIAGFVVRTLDGQGNWVTGPDPALGSGTSSGLPRAVDVVIDSRVFGAISTLVGYR
jgi:general secretion pathway protein J